MGDPEFISLEVVLQLHADSLARFGGSDGIREPGLVESALASAQNVFSYRHGDVFDIAAAYAFHLAEAQAFLDGNKRTAAAAALTFIEGNTAVALTDDGRIYAAMIAIANRQMDKDGLAQLLRAMAAEGN